MTEAIKPLEEVRREIDEIDAALHELIMRRTRAVAQVAAAKGTTNTPNFIPSREVLVLRKLLARHEGAFPRHALIRMWREMVSAFAAMQGPFHVVAYANGNEQGCWDLARDYFGSHDAMTPVVTPRDVVARVSNDDAAIGVAPIPVDANDDAWWRMLCGAVAPRVIARLPFIEGSNARDSGAGAYAIAKMAPEATGDDRALLVVEIDADVSRAGLQGLLARSGLSAVSIVSCKDQVTAYLIEVEGFVSPEDASVKQLEAADAVHAVFVIGAYGVGAANTGEAGS